MTHARDGELKKTSMHGAQNVLEKILSKNFFLRIFLISPLLDECVSTIFVPMFADPNRIVFPCGMPVDLTFQVFLEWI